MPARISILDPENEASIDRHPTVKGDYELAHRRARQGHEQVKCKAVIVPDPEHPEDKIEVYGDTEVQGGTGGPTPWVSTFDLTDDGIENGVAVSVLAWLENSSGTLIAGPDEFAKYMAKSDTDLGATMKAVGIVK